MGNISKYGRESENPTCFCDWSSGFWRWISAKKRPLRNRLSDVARGTIFIWTIGSRSSNTLDCSKKIWTVETVGWSKHVIPIYIKRYERWASWRWRRFACRHALYILFDLRWKKQPQKSQKVENNYFCSHTSRKDHTKKRRGNHFDMATRP